MTNSRAWVLLKKPFEEEHLGSMWMGHEGLGVRKMGLKGGQSLLTMSPYHCFPTDYLGIEHPWFLSSRRASQWTCKGPHAI